MTTHNNILFDVQKKIADIIRADEQLSAITWLEENRRDIEFEIKNALGKQGIVGLITTPNAEYIGDYNNWSLVWELNPLEIDIVENVAVNRGMNNTISTTGQDAAMRLFDVLCPQNGDTREGQISPVGYEQGEDNSLIVNRCRFKCYVSNYPTPDYKATIVTYKDGSVQKLELSGELVRHQIPNWSNAVSIEIGQDITSIAQGALFQGDNLESIVVPDTVTSIGENAFAYCTKLTSVTLGQSVTSLGDRFIEYSDLTSLSIPKSVTTISTYALTTGDSKFRDITFEDRTMAEVQAMPNYSWRLWRPQVIHCTDGDIVFQ